MSFGSGILGDFPNWNAVNQVYQGIQTAQTGTYMGHAPPALAEGLEYDLTTMSVKPMPGAVLIKSEEMTLGPKIVAEQAIEALGVQAAALSQKIITEEKRIGDEKIKLLQMRKSIEEWRKIL